MIVRITTKDARLTEDVLKTMEKKLHQRLDAYYRHEQEEASTIVVKVSESKRTFKVEINMPFAGHQFRTENEERENALPALDKGIDILERQIKKHKTRLNRNLRQAPTPIPEPMSMEDIQELAGDENDFQVVKVKRYASKPMSVQDALLQMDLLGHNFFTFHNADTGVVCTVYRRNDGDFGLIELVAM